MELLCDLLILTKLFFFTKSKICKFK